MILQRWARGPVGAATNRSMCAATPAFLPAEAIARIFGTMRVRKHLLAHSGDRPDGPWCSPYTSPLHAANECISPRIARAIPRQRAAA